MSNIRKTKKCCKHPKSSFTRANIRYVNIRKTKKCCKHPKTSFTMANIRYVKHPKNQNVLETSEKLIFQGKNPNCQTSEKQKSAANMRKPALPGQTSDISNIRKTKKCCKQPKSSFTRANIRYVNIRKTKGAANIRKPALPGRTSDMSTSEKPKVLQTSENQLYHGKHPICQTFKKPKTAANSEKQLFQGKHLICQTSEKPKSAANKRKPA